MQKDFGAVYLTKNGEGDLVVMDLATFNRREKMLKLREDLLSVEENRMHGMPGHSVSETVSLLRNALREETGNVK
jgi:PHD/YefM family antitoxin component YafN of YafNO toxin-antitoxin module